MVRKIWNDPVWSKVISALIISIGAIIYSFVKSKLDNLCFWQILLKTLISPYFLGLVILLLLTYILFDKLKKQKKENIISDTVLVRPKPKEQENVEKYEVEGKEIGLGEIAIYFGERKSADPTLTKILTDEDKEKESFKNIVIAAIGFNTISSILEKTEVINYIAKSIIEHPHKEMMTIIFPKGIDDMNKIRPERVAQAKKSVKDGHEKLNQFVKDLERACKGIIAGDPIRLSGFNLSTYLTLKTYNDKIMPRHFILKVDDRIFVGSYLSHKVGSNSYLLQLRKWNTPSSRYYLGLYGLFDQEINTLLEEDNTSTISFKELEEIVNSEKNIKTNI
jgi:hypothetical protein